MGTISQLGEVMAEETVKNLDAYAIQEYQQNRYPCFFLDYVDEAVPGKSARGYKNFTFNEWFFPAHFPDEPTVPGFIQIESLTQMFLMTFLTIPENKGKKTGFVSIEKAHFKKKIVPGNRLDIRAELISYRRGVAKGTSVGYVNGELACSAELLIAIPDILNQFIPVK
jgi:3-hydroxyacyl-[acyl-carrier-protein] dehydratase